jgi:hypothetical protein
MQSRGLPTRPATLGRAALLAGKRNENQIPSGKLDIIDYVQQRGGYVSSYIPRERPDTPLTSFTVVVDVPEERQEEIINQIKQLGGRVIDALPDDKA